MLRLRFRELTASSSPDAPFQIGQIITVPVLTKAMRRWLASGQAELLEGDPESAMLGASETAVQTRPKSRGTH